MGGKHQQGCERETGRSSRRCTETGRKAPVGADLELHRSSDGKRRYVSACPSRSPGTRGATTLPCPVPVIPRRCRATPSLCPATAGFLTEAPTLDFVPSSLFLSLVPARPQATPARRGREGPDPSGQGKRGPRALLPPSVMNSPSVDAKRKRVEDGVT